MFCSCQLAKMFSRYDCVKVNSIVVYHFIHVGLFLFIFLCVFICLLLCMYLRTLKNVTARCSESFLFCYCPSQISCVAWAPSEKGHLSLRWLGWSKLLRLSPGLVSAVIWHPSISFLPSSLVFKKHSESRLQERVWKVEASNSPHLCYTELLGIGLVAMFRSPKCQFTSSYLQKMCKCFWRVICFDFVVILMN